MSQSFDLRRGQESRGRHNCGKGIGHRNCSVQRITYSRWAVENFAADLFCTGVVRVLSFGKMCAVGINLGAGTRKPGEAHIQWITLGVSDASAFCIRVKCVGKVASQSCPCQCRKFRGYIPVGERRWFFGTQPSHIQDG